MPIIAENKKARFDYEILETYEAGLELKGFEVKSIKSGRINLVGSYAIIRNNEAWLINADIPPYQPKNAPLDYNSKRNRRLLLKKSEIKNLIGRIHEKGLTLMPLKIYTKNSKIKIEICLGKSRKKADKRELIRKREIGREIQRER
ncbi:MAG: SsrA-binding protein [Candidatus Wolfebacteria bacterium GW2011_GWA2_42_10]|uniref:SsrA-binding protein n=2 Tax=Candidatus Wolfeibacteriota TaxID=1752735 RepID=A0A0G0ZTN1_9BACT|nr:MAG: SsrA-binding protein [Candidatus Wolfebacteria bacterium GW2011_GWB1_41_12]KKS25376.1 MAG: SsrA-binding protein [Candidatus Wolfebacteria bacterium GW2011_GWA2_42_10]KKT56815.1 MAG: SsrA-binding protein [Candidatus Wolfebacteria bacterium GW2011_GWA1_44_24]